MNKKIIILIIIIIVLTAGIYLFINNYKDKNGCLAFKGYFWCDFQYQCVKKTESCNLTQDWVVREAKKIIGIDLTIMPNQFIKWNTESGETAFSAKGIIYTDILNAEKITNFYSDLDNFLRQSGFAGNGYNPVISNNDETTAKYNKEKIVCSLRKVNNSNGTSSLILLCGNNNDKMCDFNSDCGRACQADSDCDLFTNGCAKRIVCRNKNFNFYNDCLESTANVNYLDVDIGSCVCVENQCLPKKEKYRYKN